MSLIDLKIYGCPDFLPIFFEDIHKISDLVCQIYGCPRLRTFASFLNAMFCDADAIPQKVNLVYGADVLLPSCELTICRTLSSRRSPLGWVAVLL